MRLRLTAALLALAGAAYAHAHLESASPPAGATVDPPQEIRLGFSEAVEPKFSALTLKSASGAVEPADKPASVDAKTLVVRLGAKLKPGVYTVEWRAVSVDTHRTQGQFHFTVK